MSGDNLLFHFPVKFYSEEMTETIKIFYLDRKSNEFDGYDDDIFGVA